MKSRLALPFAFLLVSTAARAGDAPPWLREVAALKVEAPKDTDAIVLLAERVVTFDERGRMTSLERRAVRVLTKAGSSQAIASVLYTTSSGKVTGLGGFVIRADGSTKELKKDDTFDLAAAPNDVFNEARVRGISGSTYSEPGAVFGAEWTVEDRSVFTQFDWDFREHLPVRLSRLTLRLAAGFTHEAVVFNHEGLVASPGPTPGTFSWQLSDLPAVPPEPRAPPLTEIGPRLCISVFPAPTAREAGPSFRDWQGVARWLHGLAEPSAAGDAALAEKARSVAATAGSSLEKMRALGRFVQSLNYVSIQTGLGRGGGYTPHPAANVLKAGYGDCKDKANLLRTMLQEIGLKAYLVAVYLGDPTYVRPAWPSPQQFNHMIAAIPVEDSVNAASVSQVPELGRVLFFDPTSPHTPLGQLPESLQGSKGLLVTKMGGALVTLPEAAPESNLFLRETTATLGAAGNLTGTVREVAEGTEAAASRSEIAESNKTEYQKIIQSWIAGRMAGATVTDVSVDAPPDGPVTLTASFDVARKAQRQGGLVLVSAVLLPFRTLTAPPARERTLPVRLASRAYRSVAKLTIPQGYAVDELPPEESLAESFGTFKQTARSEGSVLVVTQDLTMQRTTLPPSELPKLRAFLDKVRAASAGMAVLKPGG